MVRSSLMIHGPVPRALFSIELVFSLASLAVTLQAAGTVEVTAKLALDSTAAGGTDARALYLARGARVTDERERT